MDSIFASLPTHQKFICHPHTHGTFVVIRGHVWNDEIFELLKASVPSWGKARHTLPFGMTSPTVKSPFLNFIWWHIFTFLCFDSCFLLFKMAPKCSTDVLSSVSKHKKALMCLMKKIHVLDKPFSVMSYGSAGHEFVNESVTYIVYSIFRQKCTQQIQVMYCSVGRSVVKRSSQEPNPACSNWVFVMTYRIQPLRIKRIDCVS